MTPGHARRADGHVPFVVVVAALIVSAVAVGSVLGGVTRASRPSRGLGPAADPAVPINGVFSGLTTFRGNASRTYLGEGPLPVDPVVRWRYPTDGSKLCSQSTEGRDGSPLKEWCGTGWTGQPNLVPLGDGMELREGTYDASYHFVDAGTGAEVRPPLQTGDLAKGSATSDPDGYPLYYGGSRDDKLRIVALDRPEPTVLWELDATTSVERPLWNDDWDGAPLVIGDSLLVGGENGWFYVIDLNRGYSDDGRVTVDPTYVAFPGFDDELLAAIGDEDVSIESSPAFRDGVVYFANSGGLVQGWDISDLLAGGSDYQRVFRFWTGDDTDATVVIDPDGSLYVASEFQRFGDRSRSLGQLMKLDPAAADPVVWSLPAAETGFEDAGGSWSTPALYGDRVFFTTAAGRVLAVDRATGAITWEAQIGAPAIGSPVVVGGTLVQGDCSGHLYAWDVADPLATPTLSWRMDLGDCIESTPAAWKGWLFVGTREGYVYGVADRDTPAPTP